MTDHERNPNGPSLAEESWAMRRIMLIGATLGFMIGLSQSILSCMIGSLALVLLTLEAYIMISECYLKWPVVFKTFVATSLVLCVMYAGAGLGAVVRIFGI